MKKKTKPKHLATKTTNERVLCFWAGLLFFAFLIGVAAELCSPTQDMMIEPPETSAIAPALLVSAQNSDNEENLENNSLADDTTSDEEVYLSNEDWAKVYVDFDSIDADAIWGGSYIDNGDQIILLTQNTPETRKWAISQASSHFADLKTGDMIYRTAEFPLSSLQSTATRIAQEMGKDGRISNVVSVGVRACDNCVQVVMEESNAEQESFLRSFGAAKSIQIKYQTI